MPHKSPQTVEISGRRSTPTDSTNHLRKRIRKDGQHVENTWFFNMLTDFFRLFIFYPIAVVYGGLWWQVWQMPHPPTEKEPGHPGSIPVHERRFMRNERAASFRRHLLDAAALVRLPTVWRRVRDDGAVLPHRLIVSVEGSPEREVEVALGVASYGAVGAEPARGFGSHCVMRW